MSSSFEVSHPTPLSVQAADIVRAQILRGDFELGQRINEVEVANSLGISRSPLREGLRTLAEEGLVRLVTGRGVYVANPHLDDIRELLELRLALDVLAIQLAAQKAAPDDLDRLQQTLENVTASHQPGRNPNPWTTDFHLAIYDIAGNGKLQEHGNAVHTQLRLARFRSGAAPDRVQAAHNEHQAILDTLREHDPAKAEERVREHHHNGATHILQALTALQEEGK